MLFTGFSLLSLLHVVLAQQQPKVDQLQHEFAAKEAIHDTAHLKQHLENKIDVDAEWSEDKQAFHYFTMSDLNKDQHIDGLEILKYFTHVHSNEPNSPSESVLSDVSIENLIDPLLNLVDLNNDGAIDFAEYTLYQKTISQSANKA